MIIVTGTGRSGTSVIAQLYQELGFEPGGYWVPKVRGGLEAPAIVHVNARIENDIGMGRLGKRKRRPIGRVLRRTLRHIRKGRSPRRPRLDAQPAWHRFDAEVARYGATLRELAEAHAVVKDPRFCSTLRVWAAANAPIEYVLVCVRSLDAVTRTMIAAGYHGGASEDALRNTLVYRLGLCMAALYDYKIEHQVVTFPDWVHQPDALFEAMRFPHPVSREEFFGVFNRVVRQDMITELRPRVTAAPEAISHHQRSG